MPTITSTATISQIIDALEDFTNRELNVKTVCLRDVMLIEAIAREFRSVYKEKEGGEK